VLFVHAPSGGAPSAADQALINKPSLGQGHTVKLRPAASATEDTGFHPAQSIGQPAIELGQPGALMGDPDTAARCSPAIPGFAETALPQELTIQTRINKATLF
jgi:hypothetical protein